MLTDIILLGHLWYNNQAICSKSNVLGPIRILKFYWISGTTKTAGGGYSNISLFDIAPTPLIIETSRFTTQQLDNVWQKSLFASYLHVNRLQEHHYYNYQISKSFSCLNILLTLHR